MTNDSPEINPKLIEKMLAMDLESLADALCAGQGGARRMLASEVAGLETTITRDEPEIMWPLEPLVSADEEVVLIDVPSRRNHMRASQVFVATTDYNHLAVPLALVPPECLPDPVLRNWHWWRGTGSDQLGSDAACRKLANRIVRHHDKMEKAPDRPKDLDVKFEIKTPKETHTFMTRYGWRGLWAPLCMKPEGKPDSRAAMFTKILSEKEIEGRREVKKYARRMAYEYDKIKVKPRPPASARGPFKGMYIPIPYQEMWDVIQRWMALGRPNGCNRSQVIQNLLRDQFDRLPPESDWDEKRYQWPKEKTE